MDIAVLLKERKELLGLYIKHLDTVQFNQDRSNYLYLLNYGWPDGEWEQIFKKHFMKMADLASDVGGVVVGSPSGVHFANEVLSWHRVGHLNADDVLPGLLITKTRPDYFEECYPDDRPAKPGLEDLLVIPLRGFVRLKITSLKQSKVFSLILRVVLNSKTLR